VVVVRPSIIVARVSAGREVYGQVNTQPRHFITVPGVIAHP